MSYYDLYDLDMTALGSSVHLKSCHQESDSDYERNVELENESDSSENSLDEFDASEEDTVESKGETHLNIIKNNNSLKREIIKKSVDRGKPFYVPRKPHFFEHDLRNTDCEENFRDNRRKKNSKNSEEPDCWKHDMFVEDEQVPKSSEELISLYGYDIRLGNPKSIERSKYRQRRRNYNKQTDRVSSEVRYCYDDKRGEKLYNDESRKCYQTHHELNDVSARNSKHSCSVNVKAEKTSLSLTKSLEETDKGSNTMKLSTKQKNVSVDIPPHNSLNYRPLPFATNGYKNYNRINSTPHKCSVTANEYASPQHVNYSSAISPTESNNGIERKTEELNDRVCRPLSLAEKLKELNINRDNTNFVSDPPINYYNNFYTVENRNFDFPDPPDLSVSHLSPMYHQQYLEPYYQQIAPWGLIGQPFHSAATSNFTFVKPNVYPYQNQASPVLPTTLRMDSNSYYEIQGDRGYKSNKAPESNVLLSDSSSCPSTQPKSHRYSVIRSQLLLEIKNERITYKE